MTDKIKLCVECKHCEKIIEELGARKFPEYLCRHPFFISVVHGEIETSYCSVMRSNCNNSCGYIAKWFEPREKAKANNVTNSSVKVGEVWVYGTQNPFHEILQTNTILAIKGDYVQYRSVRKGAIFSRTLSSTIESFLIGSRKIGMTDDVKSNDDSHKP